MPYDVSITYQNIPVISLDGRLRRGTAPGVFRIRIPHDADLTADPNDLRFVSDSGLVTLRKCIPDLSTLRTEHRDGKREYSLLLRDRRATWPGKQVSGRYNRRYRDNSIASSGKKTDTDIADDIMQDIGEDSGNTLYDTYPDLEWDGAKFDEAVNQLTKYLPCHVCRDSDDKYRIFQTGQGDGISTDWPAIIPDYLATVERGPKTLKLKCNKTWFGAALQLRAVGLETDGSYKPINQLSYTPANGWENEWPTLFSGVAPFNRMRAFESVFRCYQVVTPQTLNFDESVYIADLDDLDLDTRRVVFGAIEPPPAYATGIYYPWGDHPYNVADCPNVGCDFTVDKMNRLIKFEYPIFKMADCIQPADLLLHTGFHVRHHETREWIRETIELERDYGTGEWILEVPYLWRAQAIGYENCSQASKGDNKGDLEDEAQVYLDAWKSHFDSIRECRHVSVAGIHPVSLNGKLAQVVYRVGRGQVPITKVSQGFEATT